MMRPGSAPSAIAKALGIHVSERSNLGLGTRGCTDPGLRAIYIAPAIHQVRREWVIAHELAELEFEEHQGDEHEDLCQAVAAELMMPTEAFLASGTSCSWDLQILRSWWPHCSWQALVRRVSELVPGIAASAWEGARAKFRAGVQLPEDADALEAFVAAEATWSGRHIAVQVGGVTARAWATGDGRAVTLVRQVG